MGKGKIIRDLTPATSLLDAAGRVLSARLGVVRDYLPLAVNNSDEDPEYVHQLRVGARRARAALDIFALCLPPKAYKTAKKELRTVRQAAGEARDWDVFLLDLLNWKEQNTNQRQQPAMDYLLGYGLGQRSQAQAHLTAVGENQPFAFDRFIAETIVAVRKPDASEIRTLKDLSRPRLARVLSELEQALSEDLTDYEHLHQVRIIGKQLRYTMEIFISCFEEEFRTSFYPAIEEMQEILGAANDSFVAGGRLQALREKTQAVLPKQWTRIRAGIETMIRYHEKRLTQQQQAFQEWLARWQEVGGDSLLSQWMKSSNSPLH